MNTTPADAAQGPAPPNSLQFHTSDPPRLALADAAQHARKHRHQRTLQNNHPSVSTSAESSLTQSMLQMQATTTTTTATPTAGARPAAGTNLVSPTSYALFGRLRSPRISSVGASDSATPSSTSPPVANANPQPTSPYEQATSAQTLLSVLKLRQQQRGATTGADIASAFPSTGPMTPPAQQTPAASATRTQASDAHEPPTSVYPQMRPRDAVVGSTPAFSHEMPVLSAQLAAKGGPWGPGAYHTTPNAVAPPVMNQEVPELEAGDDENDENDDEARALAAGAVGLEPVLSAKMPVARCIMLNLLTTWGDDHEVGLCGVELFNQRGDPIHLEPPVLTSSTGSEGDQQQQQQQPPQAATTATLVANEVEIDGASVCKKLTTGHGRCLLLAQYAGTPEEIMGGKDLDELATDPRGQLSSLVNGQNNTHDEANMFVMPYTPGEHHLICFVFTKPTTISMIRLFNYCGRGRVHTSKGARIVEITADDVCVFRGEVAQHSGDLLTSGRPLPAAAATTRGELDAETEAVVGRWGVVDCENILFTEDPVVLERVMAQTRTNALKALVTGEAAEAGAAPGGTANTKNGARATEAGSLSGGANTTSSRAAAAKPAAPPRKMILTATKDLPRGDRSRYVGGEAPMVVSARLLPTQPGLHAVASASAPGAAAPPVTRAKSSDGKSRQRSTTSAGRGSAPEWCRSPEAQPSPDMISSSSSRHQQNNTNQASNNNNNSTGDAGPQRRQRAIKPRHPAQFPRQCPKEVRSVCLELLSTWGDTQSIGLSGLRFRDASGDLVKAALEHWAVQYPDGHRLDPGTTSAQLTALFDENHESACMLPFQPAMQVILVFAEPVPRLGFLEVANYSLGDRTFCGVKDVRVFLCSAPVVPPALSARVALPGPSTSSPANMSTSATTGSTATAQDGAWCPHVEIFARLWTVAQDPASVAALQAHRVQEVTPVAGVSLRKAPANLAQSRFQTYDLSLVANDGLDAFDALAGSQSASFDLPSPTQHRYAPIGIGPGTGGDRLDMAGTLATGGLRAGFSTTMASFATSLNASMNIRAAMSMKRARMMLRDRPDWLLDYQPYITPLLPVGYVCRVRLQLCARTVGEVPTTTSTTATSTSTATDADVTVYSSAAENMKAYLKDWVLKPLRACSFVNENGDVIRPIKPGDAARGRAVTSADSRGRVQSARRRQGPHRNAFEAFEEDGDDNRINENGDGEEEDTRSLPMVAECIVSTSSPNQLLKTASPNASTSAETSTSTAAAPFQVELELLYVADSPYCLSMIMLNPPLVLDGCAAWVKRSRIYMDDTLLFDSGEAALKLRKASAEGEVGETARAASRGARRGRGRTADGTLLPPCTTSLRSCVLFTLDDAILQDVYKEEASQSRPTA